MMPAIMLEVPVQPRLLTKAEAARYCRLSAAKFPALCPVRPLEIEDNKRVYDVRELDKWIDSLTDKAAQMSDEEILSRFK